MVSMKQVPLQPGVITALFKGLYDVILTTPITMKVDKIAAQTHHTPLCS